MVVEMVFGEVLLWFIFGVWEEVVVIGIVRLIFGKFLRNDGWDCGNGKWE